jgi:hypothetical protein
VLENDDPIVESITPDQTVGFQEVEMPVAVEVVLAADRLVDATVESVCSSEAMLESVPTAQEQASVLPETAIEESAEPVEPQPEATVPATGPLEIDSLEEDEIGLAMATAASSALSAMVSGSNSPPKTSDLAQHATKTWRSTGWMRKMSKRKDAVSGPDRRRSQYINTDTQKSPPSKTSRLLEESSDSEGDSPSLPRYTSRQLVFRFFPLRFRSKQGDSVLRNRRRATAPAVPVLHIGGDVVAMPFAVPLPLPLAMNVSLPPPLSMDSAPLPPPLTLAFPLPPPLLNPSPSSPLPILLSPSQDSESGGEDSTDSLAHDEQEMEDSAGQQEEQETDLRWDERSISPPTSPPAYVLSCPLPAMRKANPLNFRNDSTKSRASKSLTDVTKAVNAKMARTTSLTFGEKLSKWKVEEPDKKEGYTASQQAFGVRQTSSTQSLHLHLTSLVGVGISRAFWPTQ